MGVISASSPQTTSVSSYEKEVDGREKVYMVRETKNGGEREDELHKINCAKKHFEAIAAICEQVSIHGDADTVRWVATRMADYFASENPRFDREKFLTACGVV